ncbi:hypothetical protein NM688_g8900 [Phlebia brevispora]|uniref:Uncharacterized protein n=1 Tax=Phlebia brevispora TaxID=194682 RepID=A0ACC1RM62_9APHY|nr:hypothetical protein NM688_g8900 [Phlebia brevispora]
MPGMMKEDKETTEKRMARFADPTAPSSPRTPRRSRVSTPIASSPRPREGTVESPSPKGKSVQKRAKSLQRTMSIEDTQAFIDDLATKAKCMPAIAYMIHASAVADMEDRGKRLGFNTRKFIPPQGTSAPKDHWALLVVGQDKEAVEMLFKGQMQASGFGRWVTGAVVGAAAAWTTLAVW